MAKAFDPFSKPELLSKTTRHRELTKLDALYCGKQYEGRPNWWTGKFREGDEERPLRERKPCVIYKLPKAAVQQVVRFLFGDKRFPKISAETSEDTEEGYPAISNDDAETLSEWIASLIEHGNVQPNTRAIATKAVACKTAVVVLEVDRGNFRVVLPRPQDCFARFEDDDPTHPVTRLLWCYEFDKEVADEHGLPVTKRHIFRREWDATSVYVYDDAEIKHGQEVEWPAPTVTSHGLSFCPVLWLRNEAEYSSGIDGESLIADLGDEFEALDMALSRRHQGIIYLGAPQLVETGVEPGDGPDASGRKAIGEVGTHVTKHGGKAPRARRVAPDCVWTYEGKDVDVKLIETSGKAFEVGTNHVNDIRSRILETMGVVLTSMADTVNRVTVGAEMSARFLALAHAPLIALVQEYRHTWWPHGLRQILSMMMRMTVELSKSGQRVMIPGTETALPVLQKFVVNGEWVTPRMTPHWGKFFEPSASELKEGVDAAVAGKDGRVISETTAIEYCAQDFGIDSVETEIEEIEGDKAEAEQKALDEATALHGLVNDSEGPADGGAGAGGGAGPPGSSGGGDGAPARAPKKRGKRAGRGKPKPDRASVR